MRVGDIFGRFIGEGGIFGIILISVMLILFFIQLRYYASTYGRLRRYAAPKVTGRRPALSVLTVIADSDYGYIGQVLPLILAQEYDDFEVVLVDISGDPDFSEALSLAARTDRRITITRLPVNPQFPISNKMALNMAIKAAHNEHLILTTPDSVPVSAGWLARMAEGFDGADIVLGYCGMEIKRGEGNKLMRMSTTGAAMRWFSAAIKGRPYRGTARNMGLTKSVYFNNNGFNHLNLNIGEDDLFVQHIAPTATAHVVIDPDSFVRRRQWGGSEWWRRERLLYGNAFRFYPKRARRYISVELWSRMLFFISVIVAAVTMPFEIKLFAAALLLLRFIIVAAQTLHIAKKLREPGLWSILPAYDLCSPAYEAVISIKRRFRRTPGLWR